jgi:DNA helicase HerA-like ATPase
VTDLALQSSVTDLALHTLVVGMTGSGKTTFTIRYLLNVTCACRFLFDDGGRFSRRLRVTPACTARQVEEALPTRWVIFNPVQMFPDDYAAGFAWFCQWVFDCAGRGPGLKVLVVDELWQWADSRTIPRTLRLCTQAGRERGVQLLTGTQEPQRVNSSIVGQAAELVCFRLQEPKAWNCIKELGADPEQVGALPLGSFVSWNRLSGGKLAGKVF